jgi:hypothetical protein
MKRHLAAIGAITAISAAGFTGVQIASATTDAPSNNPMTSLVDAVSTKFNLNKTEVQAVFDEQRSVMEAEREAEFKEQVAQLVSDGKLTQDQADKLTAKRAELKTERDANRNAHQALTADERKAKMAEHKAELDAWFEETGIDTQYRYLLMGGHGRGGHGGLGFGTMKQGAAEATESTQ